MTAEESREPQTWLKRSAPFLIHSVMMTQFASLGIVGLELLGGDDKSVAILAAAMQTHPGVDWQRVKSLTFYNDFSLMAKQESGFKDSLQNVVGCAAGVGLARCLSRRARASP